ncbi:plasmid mobilization relaxosome protein MobC [Bacteroides acidifaciens]|uniref:plasmid mobilization protein n=1 Tax=Bacteroides acidifaciens TaxID=85831 RepID=UPI002557D67D|nr:plasmid mobilization relaxosome protein MobC [Bacteroides acidifaciens]
MKHKPSALQGGRRKHNTDENLSERITFRLSPVERKSLEDKAKERGLKLSLLCRLIVMRRKIPDRSPQTLQWFRDLVGMKNNLNQIAHHLNITKVSDQWAIEAIRFIAEEVQKAKNILTVNNYEQSI